jgi:hypothetical protein
MEKEETACGEAASGDGEVREFSVFSELRQRSRSSAQVSLQLDPSEVALSMAGIRSHMRSRLKQIRKNTVAKGQGRKSVIRIATSVRHFGAGLASVERFREAVDVPEPLKELLKQLSQVGHIAHAGHLADPGEENRRSGSAKTGESPEWRGRRTSASRGSARQCRLFGDRSWTRAGRLVDE